MPKRIDKSAVLRIYLTTRKVFLKESPFVPSLLIGATKHGYWKKQLYGNPIGGKNNCMAIQSVNAVDCLHMLRPGYEFVFLFDHTQGHDRRKDGALNVSCMLRSYGSVQPKILSFS